MRSSASFGRSSAMLSPNNYITSYKEVGVNLPVAVDTDGYNYDSSEACGWSVRGLPWMNPMNLTRLIRIDAWISGLKQVIC